jgi:hypothetical protein
MIMPNKQRVGGLGASLDPAVGSWLNKAAENTAGLTPGQKTKRAADRKRNKATYDLSADLQAQVAELSARLDVPASDVVEVLLRRALSYDLFPELVEMRTPARSLRFGYRLVTNLVAIRTSVLNGQ